MPRQDAGSLLSLLGAVVTVLAEALKVAAIEEQILIALVRLDVVDSISSLYRTKGAAQAAYRLCLQLMPPEPIPSLGLIEVMPGGCAGHQSERFGSLKSAKRSARSAIFFTPKKPIQMPAGVASVDGNPKYSSTAIRLVVSSMQMVASSIA